MTISTALNSSSTGWHVSEADLQSLLTTLCEYLGDYILDTLCKWSNTHSREKIVVANCKIRGLLAWANHSMCHIGWCWRSFACLFIGVSKVPQWRLAFLSWFQLQPHWKLEIRRADTNPIACKFYILVYFHSATFTGASVVEFTSRVRKKCNPLPRVLGSIEYSSQGQNCLCLTVILTKGIDDKKNVVWIFQQRPKIVNETPVFMFTGGKTQKCVLKKRNDWHTLLPLQFSQVQVTFFCSYNCVYCSCCLPLLIYSCIFGHTLPLSCFFQFLFFCWL